MITNFAGTREYIKLEYDSGVSIFVPVENIDRIHKYVGDENLIKLSNLKSKSWSNTKKKVRADIEEKGEGFNFYHYTIDLTGGPCIVKRVSGCGVGTEYLAVTPTGDLYPCHQFVGQDDFCVGNIYEGVTNKKVIEQFEHCNVYSHKECKDCFAKLYCAGGCAANAYFSKGNINEVYELGCKLHRKRIECAIMMKVAEEDKGLKRRSDK